jgi:hypothetical protein
MVYRRIWVFALLSLLLAWGCSRQKAAAPEQDHSQAATPAPSPSETAEATTPPAPAPAASLPKPQEALPSTSAETKKMAEAPPPPPPKPPPIVIPAGTTLTVKLVQPLGSKTNHTGDKFEATLAQPIMVKNKVVVPSGASVHGRITQAQSAGKFSGGAALNAALNELTVNGHPYTIKTNDLAHATQGKGKRSAVMIGGGAGGGALIGGLVGGGKGAAIGALVGGGAGTAGAAMTGNRDITIPAESVLAFQMTSSLTLPPAGSTPHQTTAAAH